MSGTSSLKLVAIFSVTLAACGPGGGGTPTDLAAEGEKIAQLKCASCHAISAADSSPLEAAPPLRQALIGYDIESLGLDFEAHLQSGTDVMPIFNLSNEERGALQAFIQSLED